MRSNTAKRQLRVYLKGRSSSNEDWAIFICREVCHLYPRHEKADCIQSFLTGTICAEGRKLPTLSGGISTKNRSAPRAGIICVVAKLCSPPTALAFDRIIAKLGRFHGCGEAMFIINNRSVNQPIPTQKFASPAALTCSPFNDATASQAATCPVNGGAAITDKAGWASGLILNTRRPHMPSDEVSYGGDLIPNIPVYEGGKAWA
jgi:hypothetical protein